MWRIEVPMGCCVSQAFHTLMKVSPRAREALSHMGKNPGNDRCNDPVEEAIRNLAHRAFYDEGHDVLVHGMALTGQRVTYVGPGLYIAMEPFRKIGWIIEVMHLTDEGEPDRTFVPHWRYRKGICPWMRVPDVDLPRLEIVVPAEAG